MSLSVKFMACNAGCLNCYENTIRESIVRDYDIRKVSERLKQNLDGSGGVTIHGGEPLLIDSLDLESLFQIIHGKFGSTGVQTNLLLLNKRHIELFKKYRTHVGISIDGLDADSNKSRGYDPEKVLKNIKLLIDNKIGCSAIVVVWKYNKDQINRLLTTLIDLGIMDIRLNPGISFCDSESECTPAELLEVYRESFHLIRPELSLLPHRDIIDLLLGFTDSKIGRAHV